MTNQVNLYTLDDWYGLFVNGKLVSETHTLDATELGEILNQNQPFKFTERWVGDELDDNLNEWSGRMPHKEEELLDMLNQVEPELPKTIKFYVHSSKDSAWAQFEDAGFPSKFIKDNELQYTGYEVELVYEILGSGDTKLLAVDGKKVSDEPYED